MILVTAAEIKAAAAVTHTALGLAAVAPVLFGVADGTAKTTLTLRRQRCAVILGYDTDHFRKRIEPDILIRRALDPDTASIESYAQGIMGILLAFIDWDYDEEGLDTKLSHAFPSEVVDE